MNNILKFIAVLALVLSAANAIPPPDNSYPGQTRTNQNVKISMQSVDDVGLVVLWNGKGANTLATCEWISGEHGSAMRDITNSLTVGDNYVVFVLYNKIYAGFGLFSGGKYSFDFSLTLDNRQIWRASDYVQDNSLGVKYWKVIKVHVTKDGKITASDDISRKMLSVLERGVSELEDKLNKNASIAVPF